MNDNAIFTTFPQLETRRLVLRAIALDDAEDMFENYSSSVVMRYWGSPPHQSLDDTRRMIRGINQSFRDQEGIRWGIMLKGADRLIGSCGHWRLIKQHFRSEIGYELSPAYWGQGIMPEAADAILWFGFARMRLHSVEAQIDVANLASRKVLEKVGFAQEGYLRENFFFDGRFTDTALFSLLEADFLKKRREDADVTLL
jgi:ribosomal-protein-alanine N-acetyltransferase